MRTYPNLNKKTQQELIELKDVVKTHMDLTPEEKEHNLDLIDSHLGIKFNRIDILADIEASKPDYDDIGD